MEGLELEQKTVILPAKPASFCQHPVPEKPVFSKEEIDGQLSLFNEAEMEADASIPEPRLDNLNYLKGSALGKAVVYAKNQKPYMENYLLDGRCFISNNAAENAIRPFVVERKNWLFADTPKGANASAAVYSIVETAKAYGLNVYTYLEYLILYMPDTDWKNHPELLDDLMPWSADVQNECKR